MYSIKSASREADFFMYQQVFGKGLRNSARICVVRKFDLKNDGLILLHNSYAKKLPATKNRQSLLIDLV